MSAPGWLGTPGQSLAGHKGLLGKLTACSSQHTNVSVSGSCELIANLPGLDQSV